MTKLSNVAIQGKNSRNYSVFKKQGTPIKGGLKVSSPLKSNLR